MRDPQQVTVYFHAAYVIAAVLYTGYILSLAMRSRRAAKRASGSPAT
jgi:hypothetical protein